MTTKRKISLAVGLVAFGLPLAWGIGPYIWHSAFDMSGNRIMNLGSPVSPSDAVTKSYVGTVAAPATATYILKVPTASAPNAQALSTLPAGLLKNSGTAGFEQAYAGTDYCAPVAGVCGGGSLTGSGTAGSLAKWSGTSALSVAYSGTDYCAPTGGSCGGAAARAAAEIASAIGATRWNWRVYQNADGTLDSQYSVLTGTAILAYPSVAGGAIGLYSGTNGTAYLYSGASAGNRQPFAWAAQVDDATKRVGYQCRVRLAAGVVSSGGGGSFAIVGSRAGTSPGNGTVLAGAQGNLDTTHYTLWVRNFAGTTAKATSTISIDNSWHDLRAWSDATTWKFSVDAEATQSISTPIWIDVDSGMWWGSASSTNSTDMEWQVAWCVYVWAEP